MLGELMNSSMAGKVLMIVKKQNKIIQELCSLLVKNNLTLAIEHDLGTAINRAQNSRFDVIVLDANVKGMPIERTIQILRNLNPGTKIIVKTHENSKELEAKIRKERIFYYHLDSFGYDDLRLAISSALGKRMNLFLSSEKEISRSIDQKTVLMVDENDEFVEVHRANLENHNYVVDVCYHADEAYRKVKTIQPHLIMVDVDIQVGSDGLHFMEKLMMDVEARKTPVLLIISKSHNVNYGKLMETVKSTLPSWNYLEKPVRIEDVILKVESLLTIG
jgi:DNA-binding NtrC family response regulator